MSEEGVFVRSQQLLDLNTPIKLLVAPPGESFKPFTLQGVVTRLVDEPDERGMGIKLEFSSEVERETYGEFIRRLEEQYLAGELPDEVLL